MTRDSVRLDWPERASARLRVELLRHFRLTCDDLTLGLCHVGERLVAYLALQDQIRTRDEIAGTLWPESSQARAAANLRQTLAIVRRLAPGLLRCDSRRLSLADGISVDARAQYRLIEAITDGETREVYADKLRLLRGDLLPDWDEHWLPPIRAELRQLRLISLETLAAAHLDQNRPGTALAVALSVARDEPLRESAHRLVIQAHLAHGNRAEAARQYRQYRRVLWTELQLNPDAGIQALIGPVLQASGHAI